MRITALDALDENHRYGKYGCESQLWLRITALDANHSLDAIQTLMGITTLDANHSYGWES